MATPRRTRPRVTADERQFEDWLAKQSTCRITCRINGHWWPGYELDGHSRLGASPPRGHDRVRIGAYMLDSPCLREVDGEGCGTQRRAYLTDAYTPHSNSYAYGPGYMLPEGVYLTAARRGRMRQELDIRAEEGGRK